MASINWLKMTSQKAGAMIKHMDKIERKIYKHSNKDIQKELTDKNYTIGCSSWREAVEKNTKRVAEVDTIQPPKRKKKDRVTCVSLEVPCPKAIADMGREDEFFEKAHEVYERYFGKENVQGSVIHKDEIHDYTDKVDGEYVKKESLMHMHTLVSAYTHERGINGKAFETRGRLTGLNNGMHEMVKKEFGVDFNTHDAPGHKTVEQLKLDGMKVEAEFELQSTKKVNARLRKENIELSNINNVENTKRNNIKKLHNEVVQSCTGTEEFNNLRNNYAVRFFEETFTGNGIKNVYDKIMEKANESAIDDIQTMIMEGGEQDWDDMDFEYEI